MVNVNKLRGLMVEHGYTYQEVAEKLQISRHTLYSKMKTGNFSSGEMSALVRILAIKDPVEIFFAELVS